MATNDLDSLPRDADYYPDDVGVRCRLHEENLLPGVGDSLACSTADGEQDGEGGVLRIMASTR